MHKLLLLTIIVSFYSLPCFARGGCGGGHCCHASSHGGHGVIVTGHFSSDTTNGYMTGVGWMNDGHLLIGKFQDYSSNRAMCIYYASSSPNNPETIHVKTLDKLVLAGSDTLLSYRKDSTEYCHISQHNYLSRKLTRGKVEIYVRSDIKPAEKGTARNHITVKYYGLIIDIGSIKKLDRMMRTVLPGYDEYHPFNKKKQVDIVALFKAINDFNNEG